MLSLPTTISSQAGKWSVGLLCFIWCEGQQLLFVRNQTFNGPGKVQCLLLRVLFVWSADPKRGSHMAGPVELALVWYQPLVLHPGFLIAPPVFLVSPALSCQETVLSAHQACAQPPRSDTFVTFEFAFAFAHFHLLRLALRESPSAQCFAIGAQRQCLHDQHRVDLVA